MQKDIALKNTADALLDSELSASSKTQLIADLESNIFNLNNFIYELNEILIITKNENLALQSYIAELEEQKALLLETVFAFEQLLASIEIVNTRFVVTFMFDDTVYSLVLVPIDGRVEIESPISTDYCIFHGWSLTQDGDLIDLTEYTITEDTVFYAVITRKYNVNFIYDGANYNHQIISKGSYASITNPASTDRKVFMGWSVDGTTVVNVAGYTIWEHTNFFAVIDYKYEVKFTIAGTTYMSSLKSRNSAILQPSNPTLAG
jgi:hypothetical protein